jgi:hypothetical protein
MIEFLPPGEVDCMSDLVSHHEFEVLCGELIADKQPVLDFDCAYNVIGEFRHHHLLLHHLLLLLVMKYGFHTCLVLLVTGCPQLAPIHPSRGEVAITMLSFCPFSIR